MTNIFNKRDRWGNWGSLWILAGMAFLLPLAFNSISEVEVHNDVANWLPKDDPQAMTLAWYAEHFPITESFLLSWDDSSLADPRARELATRLQGYVDKDGIRREGSVYFEHVITPTDLIDRITRKDVTFEDGLDRIQGILVGGGPIKVRLTPEGRRKQATFERMLKEQVEEQLGVEVTIDERDHDLIDYLEEQRIVALEADEDADVSDANLNHDVQVSFPKMQVETEQREELQALINGLKHPETDEPFVETSFFIPGVPAAMSVELSEAGAADRKEAFIELREIAASVGIDPETIRMGGRPVASEELDLAVARAGFDPSQPPSRFWKRSVLLTSIIVGVLLAYIMLRSVKLATLVQIAAGYTVILAIAVVPALGGSMNMVLVVMPTLLMVLTSSAAIHVVNYWKHAMHSDRETAVADAYRMARVPCGLAAFTTAVGLISLGTSPLTPVRDFGVFSAIGCIISLGVVLFGLPAMIAIFPNRKLPKIGSDSAVFSSMGRGLSRHSTIVTVLCSVAFVGCAIGLKNFRTETKVIRYFPDDSRVVQDYNFLEENLAGIIPVDTVVRFDKESQQKLKFVERVEIVRRIEHKLATHPEISGTVSLADFLPEVEVPDFDSLTGTRRLFAEKNFNTRDKRTLESVEESEASSSFRVIADKGYDLYEEGDRALNDEGDELWKITAQVAIMSDMDYGELTHELDELVQSETKYSAGTSHRVTGLIPIFLRTQQAVLESLIQSFALAFGLIAIVMMMLLRSVVAGLLTMLPNLLPVGVVFGLISWAGLRVDIGTMITASVALGIAVDGTLHLLTWFRKGVMDGLKRGEAISEALAHCGPAMWQTSAAIGLGLFMLSPADLLLISRFGWLMSALIGTALIADVVFLPALLAGPLGAMIEKSVLAEKERVNEKARAAQRSEGNDGQTMPVVTSSDSAQAASTSKVDGGHSEPGRVDSNGIPHPHQQRPRNSDTPIPFE